jgi:nucleoside phosphorylase
VQAGFPDGKSQIKADILLIAALNKELDWFKKTMGIPFEPFLLEGTSYLHGILRNGDREITIVAVRQLEMGLTSAAVMATKSICLWQPAIVVMSGICAGVKSFTQLGDLVVASQCFEHISGQLVEGEMLPRQKWITLEHWFLDYLMSFTDSGICQPAIQGGYAGLLPADFTMQIHYGSMACGPVVIKDADYVAKLRRREQSLIAFDMESYGVALAATMCSTAVKPIHAVIVKGVVDFADNSKNDQWHDYAAYASAAFIKQILELTFDRPVAFGKLTGSGGHD